MDCLSPAGTNGIAAYRCSVLPDKVEALPLTHCVVGENVYTPTEHVLVPLLGLRRKILDRMLTIFTYYSQEIELKCALGVGLVSMLGILKAPLLSVKLKNAKKIIYYCTWLHNFCINEDDAVPEINHEDPKELPPEYYIPCAFGLQGQSHMRELVLEKVNSKGLTTRPLHNLIRKKNNC